MSMTPQALNAEFDRQLETLVERGYPTLAGMTETEWRRLLEPLRACVLEHRTPLDLPTSARVPFVIVVGKKLIPITQTMALTSLNGREGFVSADTADIDAFEPIESVQIPDPTAYVVFDVERGKETLGVRPNDAIEMIAAQGRSPMTIDEGVAFLTMFPGSLEKNNCFQLLASRVGDKRVPGLWISDKRPKLGFCWAGNTHTWLGAASCAARAG